MSMGKPLPHDAAPLHVTGQARYVDDIPLPGNALHLAFGLSHVAHGAITALDLEAARTSEGVIAVLTAADLPFAKLGFGVCYDVRFPHLFRAEAMAGAEILTTPAAFTKQTGEAHWEILLRARAIENGAYVISAAQAGVHEDGRETFGHSMIVGPWGKVLASAGGAGTGGAAGLACLDQQVWRCRAGHAFP